MYLHMKFHQVQVITSLKIETWEQKLEVCSFQI